MEIWKPVYGLEKRYEASSYGRVRGISISRAYKQPRFLACPIVGGYAKAYIIDNDGKKRTTFIHKLVCLAFHGKQPTDQHTVNHKDGNKLNNTPENLEWATRREQMVHAYNVLNKAATMRRGKGSHHYAAYSDDEIREIRSLRRSGIGYKNITKQLGNKTSWVSVRNIIIGQTYFHVT